MDDKGGKSTATTKRTDEMGWALAQLVQAAQALRRAGRARAIESVRMGMRTGEKVLDVLEAL
jgi:hypothetical protein